jgi:thiamine pyrophosphate-dependent acetolactate synthase large subunit-like protein
VTHLNPEAQYEKIADAFGGKGFSCDNEKDLDKVCSTIFSSEENKYKFFVVNVHIQPDSSKKPQEDSWLTRNAPQPKL